MVHCRDRRRTSLCTSTRAIHGPHTSLQRTIGPSLPKHLFTWASAELVVDEQLHGHPQNTRKIPQRAEAVLPLGG